MKTQDLNEILSTVEAQETEMHNEIYRDLLSAIKGWTPEELPEGMDVRLQISEDGSWQIHTGDASYDQDHRGWWGASSISADAGEHEAIEVSRNLVEQAIDHLACSI